MNFWRSISETCHTSKSIFPNPRQTKVNDDMTAAPDPDYRGCFHETGTSITLWSLFPFPMFWFRARMSRGQAFFIRKSDVKSTSDPEKIRNKGMAGLISVLVALAYVTLGLPNCFGFAHASAWKGLCNWDFATFWSKLIWNNGKMSSS